MSNDSSGLPDLISIIIPTYNSAGTLESCLKSIVSQQYTSIEVVIVDGKSVDGTIEIVKRHALRFPFIEFVSEPDKGTYDAMNKGIKLARGNWLIFLGADDELYDDTVLLTASGSLKKTSARFVYGNAKIVGDSFWAKDGEIYDGPFSLEKLFKKNICHQAIFYHRSVFEEIGYYNVKYPVCADWDFNFRCFARVEVKYVDQVISRFSGGGLSSTFLADDFNKDSVIILKEYFKISYWNSLFRGYAWVFFNKGGEAFRNKKFNEGIRYFVLSLRHAKSKTEMIGVALGSVRKWLFNKRS